jgi:hypothetical protein
MKTKANWDIALCFSETDRRFRGHCIDYGGNKYLSNVG